MVFGYSPGDDPHWAWIGAKGLISIRDSTVHTEAEHLIRAENELILCLTHNPEVSDEIERLSKNFYGALDARGTMGAYRYADGLYMDWVMREGHTPEKGGK